jgi:hypothetical protein
MVRPDPDHPDWPDGPDAAPAPLSSDEPVMVFYDGEFTDLQRDSELLSIGFVLMDGDAELYIEIADADVGASSDFVKETVLPLFGRHAPEVLTRADAAARIEGWLDALRNGDRKRPIHLVADSGWDWLHLASLFPGRLPRGPSWASKLNLVSRTVQHLLDQSGSHRTFHEAVAEYHRQHGEQHHALVDARALKAGWEAVRKSGTGGPAAGRPAGYRSDFTNGMDMDKPCNNPFGNTPSGRISDEDFDRWFDTLPAATLQVIISRCREFGEPQVQNEVNTLYLLEKAKAIMNAMKDGRVKTLGQSQVRKPLARKGEHEPVAKKKLALPEGVTIEPLVGPELDLEPLIATLPRERQAALRTQDPAMGTPGGRQ